MQAFTADKTTGREPVIGELPNTAKYRPKIETKGGLIREDEALILRCNYKTMSRLQGFTCPDNSASWLPKQIDSRDIQSLNEKTR